VTNAQWKQVMGSEPPSKWREDDRPVETVDWDDAVAFCEKLSGMPEEQKAGRVYRMPTEAEWEYACRAGTTTRWSSGDDEKDLKEFAWFKANSGDQTHPVGQKRPNPWGLHDMHGNVWEWCTDGYGPYPGEAMIDPVVVLQRWGRVHRGGSYTTTDCRSANRYAHSPLFRSEHLGFRLALSPSGSISPDQAVLIAAPPPQKPTGSGKTRAQTIQGFGSFDIVRLSKTKAINFYQPKASSGLPVSGRIVSGPATLTIHTNHTPPIWYLSFSEEGVVVLEVAQEGNPEFGPVSEIREIRVVK